MLQGIYLSLLLSKILFIVRIFKNIRPGRGRCRHLSADEEEVWYPGRVSARSDEINETTSDIVTRVIIRLLLR